ncbi:MAG: hypothetical protein C0497_06010 [Gemmatimonas sp.]|nr:hypothetical protein [Gemmatimonas sp.]
MQGVVETAYAIDGWRRRASGVIVLGYLAALRARDAPGDGVTLSVLRAPLADWASGAEHNTVIRALTIAEGCTPDEPAAASASGLPPVRL